MLGPRPTRSAEPTWGQNNFSLDPDSPHLSEVGPKEVGITAPRHRPDAAQTIAQWGQKNLPLDHGWSQKKIPLWGQKRLLQTPDVQRLAALHDQTLRLGRVVQDLADLSAAESAALSLHPVDIDLAEVARAALAAQRPHLDSAGLRVDTDLADPVPVRADPDRIHQAIANLLANAVRYCRPGDRVTVRVHVERAVAVFTIADTGPGIPAEDLPYVFDRLWRGHHARAVAGFGIGLAVVRELVTAHRGTVTADSPPTGGTTLTIRLPAPDADAGPAPR